MVDDKFLSVMKEKLKDLDEKINDLKEKSENINKEGNEIFTNDIQDIDKIREALHSSVSELEGSTKNEWKKIKAVIKKDEEKLLKLMDRLKLKF